MEQQTLPKLTANEKANKHGLTLDGILEKTASFYGYTDISQVITPSRKRELVRVRQQYCRLAKEYTKHSLSEIGKNIGERDHATVLHACKQVEDLITTDKRYRAEFEDLRNCILGIQPEVLEPIDMTEIINEVTANIKKDGAL
jgi:chromosomal replication initiation ATPase DnaA